jgi:hypothetical protein
VQKHGTKGRPLIRELVHAYRRVYDGPPDWAWAFAPSIPFVGRNYTPTKGLLIYASAENLTWLNDTEPPERFNRPRVWDRYRAVYEEEGRLSGSFFPEVGIAPISNGGLLTSGLYVSQRLLTGTGETPRIFVEEIAFSNWAKFSVKRGGNGYKGTRNMDYISDPTKTKYSLAFVLAELSVLKPAVVLLPQTVWPVYQAAMRGVSPHSQFLAMPQCNATVLNCHLSELDSMGVDLCQQLIGSQIEKWVKHVSSIKPCYLWRYMALLEKKLRN